MNIKKNNGAILAWTIIIIAVFLVLGTVVLFIANNDTKQVMRQQKSIQSFYVARAGADALASYLIDHPDEFDLISGKVDTVPATGELAGQNFETKISGNFTNFVIESKSFNSDDSEAAALYLSMHEVNMLDFAIFAYGELDMGNGILVSGNVGTNLNQIDTFALHDIDGSFMLGPDATQEELDTAEDHSTGDAYKSGGSGLGYLDIDEGGFGTDWAGFYDSDRSDLPIDIEGEIEWTLWDSWVDWDNVIEDALLDASPPYSSDVIDTIIDEFEPYTYEVSGDESYKIDKIILSGGVDYFKVTGSGNLHVLVDSAGTISASGSKYFSTEGDAKLFLYYLGTNDITFNGKEGSHIFLYAPYSKVKFNGGGSGSFYGTVICDNFIGPDSGVPFERDEEMLLSGLKLSSDRNAIGYQRGAWRDTKVIQ